MKKLDDNILDQIMQHLEIERVMGTEWLPVRKPAEKKPEKESRAGGSGSKAPAEKAAAGSGARADARRDEGSGSGPAGGLPVVEQPLSAADGREIDRRMAELARIEADVKSCVKCPLHQSRTLCVVQDGSPGARLCFVGEGPGYDEDISGIPFVGKAGQLLTKIISAMGLRREDVYICNTVKCRPPGNRTPTREEMETCWPFLRKQLETLKPDCIVALGLPAAQMLIKGITSISSRRGRWTESMGIPVMPTYHPAYLLRNASAKKLVWEDMKKVHQKLSEKVEEKEIVKAGEEAKPTLSLFNKKG
ncbi:MAG: uracil-DNA glycosylase [Pseudomonadota bacterium]